MSKRQDLIEVQQWIIENTELVADYGAYEKALDVVGEHGVVALTGHGMWLHRTPPSGNRLGQNF